MLEPEVLLLDEPTGALDEESVGLVETLLREKMSAGTAVVLVTHNPSQAIRLGDRRYRMNAGRLSAA
jgi:ABC-type sulfate/molybdate transport systems ATPase subunit